MFVGLRFSGLFWYWWSLAIGASFGVRVFSFDCVLLVWDCVVVLLIVLVLLFFSFVFYMRLRL